MKILMTSETYLPLLGGAEMHVFYLKRELERAGHTVRLFTHNEIPWSKKNFFKILHVLWGEVGKCDLVHAHHSYRLAAIAGVVGRLRRKPVVVTLHGLGILDARNERGFARMATRLYRSLSLHLATRAISTSRDLAEIAYRYIPKEKVAIIYNGINTEKFNGHVVAPPMLTEKYAGKKVILTVRRLVPKNGIQYLVAAMPEILARVPNAHCILIGDGRMHEYIKTEIQRLKLQNHVEMLGDIENERVPEYLKLASVMVFPSTAESSSIACAEAMAVGTPVVASRVGGLVELLGEGEERGTLVKIVPWEHSNFDAPLELPPERSHELVHGIVSVLEHPPHEKTRAAQIFALEHLNWRAIARETLAVYHQVT